VKLYIAKDPLPALCGVVVEPQHLALKLTHLVLASRQWDELFIDVVEDIPEGTLRFLPKKCNVIHVCCPEHPTLHQLHLLVELYPELDGKLRKAYMKGDTVHGLLPEMWEHGGQA